MLIKEFLFCFSLAPMIMAQTPTAPNWGLHLGLNYCTNVAGIDYFDGARFQGAWAEIASTPYSTPQNESCVYFDFRQVNEAGEFVYLRAHKQNGDNGKHVYIKRTNIDNKGKGHIFGYDFQIISTDYETYAILFSCIDLILWQTENVWILMRGQPSNQTSENIFNALHANKIDPSRLSRVDQNGCYQFLDDLSYFYGGSYNGNAARQDANIPSGIAYPVIPQNSAATESTIQPPQSYMLPSYSPEVAA